MAQRGRKSAASLAVVADRSEVVGFIKRAQPPRELSDEEAGVWLDVVNSMPATWFGKETYPLLVQYCRHVIRANRVAQLINNVESQDNIDVSDYGKLLTMAARETLTMTTLATKMRIAQQSTLARGDKKAGVGMKKPWQEHD